MQEVFAKTSVRSPLVLLNALRDHINHESITPGVREELLKNFPSLSNIKYLVKRVMGGTGTSGCTAGRIQYFCRMRPPPPVRQPGQGPLKCKQSSFDIPIVLPNYILEYSGTVVTKMLLVYTTASMLATASHAKFLTLDGTYNLCTQRVIGIAVGVMDACKQTHTVAIGLTLSECTESYAEVLRQVRQATQDYFIRPMTPLVVQADGAYDITAAVAEVFADRPPVRASCYFHVVQAIRRHVLGINMLGKILWGRLKADIDLLTQCWSEYEFTKAVALFFAKWRSIASRSEQAEAAEQLADEMAGGADELSVEDLQKIAELRPVTEDVLKLFIEQSIVTEITASQFRELGLLSETGGPREVDQEPNPAFSGNKKGLRSALTYLSEGYLNPTHFRSRFYAGSLGESGQWCSRNNCGTEGRNMSLKRSFTQCRSGALESLLRSLSNAPMMSLSMESRNEPINRSPKPTTVMLYNAARMFNHFSDVCIQFSIEETIGLPDLFLGKSVSVFYSEDSGSTEEKKADMLCFLKTAQTSLSEFSKDKDRFCAVYYAEQADFRVSPPSGISCSCICYQKNNVCSHAICISMVKGTFVAPEIARVPMHARAYRIIGQDLGNRAR
jgi:hypothetical protein